MVPFFIFLLFSLQTLVLVNTQKVECNSNDLTGLKAFVNGFDSPIEGWVFNDTSSSCCNWVGIKCEAGRIVEIDLSKKRLSGNLSDALFRFEHLMVLNLSYNYIQGPLPNVIFHFGKLEVLDLSSNEIRDVLPNSIDLPKLDVLDLSANSFSGVIPSGLCVNSSRVRVVRLAVNYFNGSVPKFENCRLLEQLYVASNYLYGDIPKSLFGLPRLGELALQENRFTGFEGIGNSTSGLVRLNVSSNRLTGKIPDWFDRFPNLSYFIAHSNNLSGGVPLSLLNSRSVSSVNLRNNSLNGLIGFNCSSMVNLTSLDLGTNNFSGNIPGNLASCGKLKALNLARNKLVGQIPESFKNFESLSYLSLSNGSFNNLSMSLKILQHCPNLSVLVLTMNFHTEQLPSDDELQFKSLKALVIANCRLTGSIPSWLNGLTQLQLLDLSWNDLTGTIPAYLGNLKSLFYLDLSNNSLSGEIPKSLTQLPSLISRDISLEEPSLDFPFFKRKRNLTGRGQALRYNQIMGFPPSIDLSSNLLTGPIWSEFGNLKKLHVLDLKHNNLSGTIPSALSGMRSIETLDMSYNNLMGSVPTSFVTLPFLSKFSVAYNNLMGMVPSRGQLATFSNSSFEGNPDLCWGGLTKVTIDTCQKNQDLLPPPTASDKDEDFSILRMVVIIGFGTGFLVTVISLLVIPGIMGASKTDKFE
ncbi:Concanavalin A-like lectin/glucanase, subgroup [Artemisia annua]|uniref:Concanavalin A-like lectin/glucanase, subgroup n=1 Tax=Artemisia annua TaxID=35608 RepID=A0A2U1Q0S2_ARTAN|nr:Concanavalin A-like lectin/glucanase, subgroup [Artemisia annua]